MVARPTVLSKPRQHDDGRPILNPMPPRKRQLHLLTGLRPPPCSPAQADEFATGLRQFDRGEYWQAHECWEQAWRMMGDTRDDDAEVVLRGLIQLAAACHCAGVGRWQAAHGNLHKAWPKLASFPQPFWGVDLAILGEALTPLIRLEAPELTPLLAVKLVPTSG